MKNREIKLRHLFLALVIVLISVFILSLIADYLLNGIFLSWIADSIIDASYPLSINTNALKHLAVTGICVIVACGTAAAFIITKRLDQKNADEFRKAITEYIKSDNDEIPEMPERYEAVAKEIYELKDEVNRKTWLVKEETSRKNDLITYLAHDLKTPITSIIGYLSILSEADDMPEKQRKKYIGIALAKSYRLDELINEFFDITRYNLSSIQLDKKNTDISYMLVQIADEFYPMLKEGQQIELEDNNVIRADVDPDKIARVFNNIIKNAVLYGHKNTVIKISAKADLDNVIIKISNRGDTIPKEKLERIFEKFYRLDESRNSSAGAGLGLAIAKEIVTLHGGQIDAGSKDGITEFTVVLPKA